MKFNNRFTLEGGKKMPEKHYYIYRFLNDKQEIIYVGKTKLNLRNRILTHIKLKTLNNEQLKEIYKIQYIEVDNEFDWHILEIFYINYFKAKYNKEFVSDNENYSILNLNIFLDKYIWKDYIEKDEFQEMLKNSDKLYNKKGIKKPQVAEQLNQKQFNEICMYLQQNKKESNKICWLIFNLLAYSKINLSELVELKWNNIPELINKSKIPQELITYYKTNINSKIKNDDYIFKSSKQGFILPRSITTKIKILLNKFFKGNYNSKSFKQINEDYYTKKINTDNIIWLQ